MDEAIKILREQTILSAGLLKLFSELSEKLRDNSSEISGVVQKIEPLMRDLSKNEVATKEFLEKNSVRDFGEFLSAQVEDVKREVAENLLRKLVNLQAKMKAEILESGRLLENNKAFVDFNLNVLAQTSAGGYGAAATAESRRGKGIFEANV